jgi:predicted RNA-binding protein with RPS1 domain
MSWTRVRHPSELLQVGDRVRVMVLGIENNGERISLGRRQVLPDPWKVIGDKVKPGQMVKAVITRTARVGAFARIEGIEGVEVEGFIPIREMAEHSVSDPKDIVQPGQTVEVKVLEVRPDARKMTLSLAEADQERQRQEYRQIMGSRAADESSSALGDAFRAAGLAPEEAQPEQPAEPPPADEAEASETAEPAEMPAEAEEAEPAETPAEAEETAAEGQ